MRKRCNVGCTWWKAATPRNMQYSSVSSPTDCNCSFHEDRERGGGREEREREGRREGEGGREGGREREGKGEMQARVPATHLPIRVIGRVKGLEEIRKGLFLSPFPVGYLRVFPHVVHPAAETEHTHSLCTQFDLGSHSLRLYYNHTSEKLLN